MTEQIQLHIFLCKIVQSLSEYNSSRSYWLCFSRMAFFGGVLCIAHFMPVSNSRQRVDDKAPGHYNITPHWKFPRKSVWCETDINPRINPHINPPPPCKRVPNVINQKKEKKSVEITYVVIYCTCYYNPD